MAVIIGSIELSRGAIPPLSITRATDQTVHKNEDGSVHITERLYGHESFIRLKVKVPIAEAQVVADYLVNGLRFRAVTTYLSAGGESWTARFWDKKVLQRQIGAGLVELDLLFRQEVGT